MLRSVRMLGALVALVALAAAGAPPETLPVTYAAPISEPIQAEPATPPTAAAATDAASAAVAAHEVIATLAAVATSAPLATPTPIATPARTAIDTEIECLAVAVYHEARGEPRAGQLAVAQVVVNRARSGRFARTLCGVVSQPGQFPFKTQAAHKRNPGQWSRALDIARRVAEGVESVVGGALYFHAARVAPGWRRARIATIGNHIFYR